jgi:hypothetical protein
VFFSVPRRLLACPFVTTKPSPSNEKASLRASVRLIQANKLRTAAAPNPMSSPATVDRNM